MKPKRSYAGEVSYLGGGISDDNILEIEGVVAVETSSNDELLVMNKSSFYMCPAMAKTKIAFICVHNSCRSQMAEAFGKVYLSEKYDCYSAGTETKPQINRDAL